MKVLNSIDNIFFTIAKLSIFICMFITTLNALGRYIFNRPIAGAYEFTELYLMVIMVFLSISFTWRAKGLISITIFSDKFPQVLRNIVYFLVLILGIFFFFLIGYEGFLSTYTAWTKNQVVSGLIPWPMYLSIVWIPIGCLMVVLRMLFEIILGIRNIMHTGINSKIFMEEENLLLEEDEYV